jgi:RNA polymerase sigma-70 factor (ECF subfamily)
MAGMAVSEPSIDRPPQVHRPVLAPVSDEQLVEQIRAGKAFAGEDLVRRYYRPLIQYLQRLTASDHLAEDLHQQTWLSVLEHIDRFDAKMTGGFKAWLFRIATNKANDHWRSSRRQRSAKSNLRLIMPTDAPAADGPAEGSEQTQKLRRAIEMLPENQRQVLTLRYYGELKFVEIAQIIGCPLNTALGRMHKAMLRLKDLMA